MVPRYGNFTQRQASSLQVFGMTESYVPGLPGAKSLQYAGQYKEPYFNSIT